MVMTKEAVVAYLYWLGDPFVAKLEKIKDGERRRCLALVLTPIR